MGTESGVSNFEASPSKLLPGFVRAGAFEPDGGESAAEFSDPSKPEFLFTKCLPVMGMLHIFSNASKDLYKILATWEQVYKSFKVLEPLVCNKDRLRKFAHTCLADTPYPHALFSSVANHLYDKRWGEVFKFCRWLLSRLPVLRDTWDAAKFQVSGAMIGNRILFRVQHFIWAPRQQPT